MGLNILKITLWYIISINRFSSLIQLPFCLSCKTFIQYCTSFYKTVSVSIYQTSFKKKGLQKFYFKTVAWQTHKVNIYIKFASDFNHKITNWSSYKLSNYNLEKRPKKGGKEHRNYFVCVFYRVAYSKSYFTVAFPQFLSYICIYFTHIESILKIGLFCCKSIKGQVWKTMQHIVAVIGLIFPQHA